MHSAGMNSELYMSGPVCSGEMDRVTRLLVEELDPRIGLDTVEKGGPARDMGAPRTG